MFLFEFFMLHAVSFSTLMAEDPWLKAKRWAL